MNESPTNDSDQSDYKAFVERLFRQNEFSFKLGTDRIGAALRVEGRPDQTFQTVLVAGTNGKGSVASLIHAGLVGSGLRVGLFTSPHLVDVRERIRVDGLPIDEEAFVEIGQRCLTRWSDDVTLKERLTFFELLTLMAVLHFSCRNVDLAVIEVGLGGRLDATNALEHQMAVITPVGFDHTKNLGNTINAIFSEKAATIVPNQPALACRPDSWSVADVRNGCQHLEPQPLWVEGDEFEAMDHTIRLEGASSSADWVPFHGHHQLRNSALALAALDLARSRLGWPIATRHELEAHLATARWPGRWTEITIRQRTVHIDCAHNEEAAQAAGKYLAARFGDEGVTLVFGALKNKPIESMLAHLIPHAKHIIIAPIDNPRAWSNAHIVETIGRLGRTCSQSKSVAHAIDLATERDSPIVALGSIFLVGGILRLASANAESLGVIG